MNQFTVEDIVRGPLERLECENATIKDALSALVSEWENWNEGRPPNSYASVTRAKNILSNSIIESPATFVGDMSPAI